MATIGYGMGAPMSAGQLGMRILNAKCVGAGTSAPTGLEGDAASVSRSGTGVYVVTFAGDVTFDVRDCQVSIRQAGSKDLFCTWTYDEAARTVTVNVKNGASSFAEIDLTTSETLHVTLLVNMSATPV